MSPQSKDTAAIRAGAEMSVGGRLVSRFNRAFMNEQIQLLLRLSHEIGREDRSLATLGEGNTSVKLNSEQFAVKASGCCLATLKETEVTTCDTAQLLGILEK